MIKADKDSRAELCRDLQGRFQAAAIAPAATRQASYNLRRFFAIDACHTKSQFPMMLMIFCGLDSNDNVLLLAWALVPTENEY